MVISAFAEEETYTIAPIGSRVNFTVTHGLNDTRQPELYIFFTMNNTWQLYNEIVMSNLQKSGCVISLFSGAGGLDLGFKAAGLKPDVCFELDQFAVATLQANNPDMVTKCIDINNLATAPDIKTEVRNLSGYTGEKVLAVIGGPPCQSFSTAGKRMGFNDPRGRLVLSYLTIVEALSPEYCVFENVRGITSMHVTPGDTTSQLLVDFIVDKLKSLGYYLAYGILNAADYGVAQKRERFVIIGCRSKLVPLPKPTHSKQPTNNLKAWITLGDAIKHLEHVIAPTLAFSPATQTIMQSIPEGGNWRNLNVRDQKLVMGGAFLSGGGNVGFFRRLTYDQPAPTLVTSPVQKATVHKNLIKVEHSQRSPEIA